MSRMTKTKIIVIFMIASMAATWTPGTVAFASESDVTDQEAIVQPAQDAPPSFGDDIVIEESGESPVVPAADDEPSLSSVPEQPLSDPVEPSSGRMAPSDSANDLREDESTSDDVAKPSETAEEDEDVQAADEALTETDADTAAFRSAAPLASAPMLGVPASGADSEEEAEVVAPAVDYTRILDHIGVEAIYALPIDPPRVRYIAADKRYQFYYPCEAVFRNTGMDAYVRMTPSPYQGTAPDSDNPYGIPVNYADYTVNRIGIVDPEFDPGERPFSDVVPDEHFIYWLDNPRVTSDGIVYFEHIVPKGYLFFVQFDASVSGLTWKEVMDAQYGYAATLGEAIQPRNIPFDFDSDDPWQGIPIELSENPERDPQGILTVTETDDSKKDADITASTTYKGEDGNYYEDDLSRAIQPGDVVRLNVKLVVKGDEGASTKVTYHFRLTSSVDELTEYLNRDLESILTAYISQNSVDLGIAPVQSSGTLGTFKAGDILELTYVVNVAGMELIDKFQSEDFTIHVDFAFEPVEDVPEEPVEPPVTPPEEPETPEAPDEPTPPSEPSRVVHTHAVPRTGDNTRTVIPAALLGISLVLIGCGIALRRWQRR